MEADELAALLERWARYAVDTDQDADLVTAINPGYEENVRLFDVDGERFLVTVAKVA